MITCTHMYECTHWDIIWPSKGANPAKIFNDMDESAGHYAKYNKPDREIHITIWVLWI